MTSKAMDKIIASFGIGGCLLILSLIPIFIVVCGYCWEYTLDTWLAYAGKPNDFPLWGGCLLSIVPVLGQLAIPGAIGTWIAMMFLS